MAYDLSNILLEEAPFAVWAIDLDHAVLESNSKAKALAPSPFDCFPSAERELLLQRLKDDVQEGPPLVLSCSREKAIRWLSIEVRRLSSMYLIYASDVTLLKDHELSQNQILHAIPDLILVKGPKSRLLWANKAFQEYYGMSNEELKNLIDAPYVEPDFTKQYVADDAWVWENQKTLEIDCEPVVKHDGEVRKFQTIKTPILDPNGKTKMTVGISRDITEKLEFQEKSIAAAKMASLGEMAGSIAHEIFNPLQVIIGQSNMIQRNLERNGINPEKLQEGLKNIISHSHRITKIVEGLKHFCQDSDRGPIQDVNFREVLTETLTFCTSRLNSRGIELRLEVPQNLHFKGRGVEASQIILNLLNNAIDAVSGEELRWIKLSASVERDYLEVRVEDSGRGVPQEIEGKIFTPFYTTKEIGKGTGLGLSISSSIAKRHGGSLTLDRQTSPSCFLLRLPLA